jgi:hypothetical protein
MSAPAFRGASVVALCATLLALGGCGGGGGGGGGSSGGGPAQPIQNTQPVIVDAGPADTVNLLFTSVTICAPGSSSCQTIDHIQVDTGSSGLRILASALNSAALSLPAQTDAAGAPVVECIQFVDGYSWGPVKLADVRIAGESAGAVPIQVIGDPAYPRVPANCSSSGPPENTVATFGANGILGVGNFLQDCGAACVSSTSYGLYYACPGSATCQPTTLALAKQVPNPAAMFGSDNNGVIIDLPALPPSGAATASGSLIFGIGTQSDNALGTATVIPVDPQTGNVVTVYNGVSYTDSFFDSGSSALFFGTSLFPICTGAASGLYCPPSVQTLSAAVHGVNGVAITVTFSITNADTLFSSNPSFTAFNDFAAPSSDSTSFDWGLPFFYGRRVYTAFEGRSTSGGTGPYVAF